MGEIKVEKRSQERWSNVTKTFHLFTKTYIQKTELDKRTQLQYQQQKTKWKFADQLAILPNIVVKY
jgi:hypothetical protein